MAKLKPCPFCGGEAEVDILEHQYRGFPKTYGVMCLNCNCGTDWFFETEEEAVAAWNRRAEEGATNGTHT